MTLIGKKALVTGSALGIGRGCAMELARAGADVALNDRERSPEVERLADEVRALGREAVVVEGDAFERSACERITARAVEAFGRIDILISNPARNRRADFLEYDPSTFEAVVAATLTGGFHMSQLVARHMVAPRVAAARSCSSRAFTTGCRTPRSVAYNAAKAGLKHMAFTDRRRAAAAPDQRQRDRAGLDRHARRGRDVRPRNARRGRTGAPLGPARHARKTSGRPPRSSRPTTPTTSPARPCSWTAGSGSTSRGRAVKSLEHDPLPGQGGVGGGAV